MAAVTPEEIKLAWKKVKKMAVVPDVRSCCVMAAA